MSELSRVVPLSTVLRLAGSWLVVGLFFFQGSELLAAPLQPLTASWVFLLLFCTILAAAFGVVHEADHLARQLGEPYGTLILTLSIVSIEVILIASMLLGPGELPTIGRDSIFAVMMIIMNLVIGLCLVAGAARNGEQEYNAQGAGCYLSMIVLLTGIALLLPNFTSGAGEFSATQAMAISAITVLLYGAFLWLQVGSHRRFFVQPPAGRLHLPQAQAGTDADAQPPANPREMLLRTLVLLGLILPIVLLAHYLAVVTDYGIAQAGAPVAVGGVLIAIIVFTPESITAIKAACNNEMQRTLNLCLGAFVSTVGLTVPAVLVIGLITQKQVIMGLSAAEMLLFAITVGLTLVSFGGQRTSPLQGFMHLAVFAVFGLLLFYP
ncbi:calcium:proton antiporter [Pseudomonas sp. MSSRFD41]|uniref:calcium:proton antiporter n=1 Tax=Pseudomonas sp. MSSRFD41 TaxID=1310370 RepID=UPI001639973C|nr:calcium:proton antiporter [Pseudomonas sp. MSSRFD41]MBC2658245.1 calcium:proton antiporter [Pseudomonas sp. MSSRFD41]